LPISGIAAYGAFIVPKIIGEQLTAGHIEYALYGFAVFYVLCLVLNWWYYERKSSGIEC
jgi:NNP family nitrate/nitrite transporter-like MFS transporter